MSKQLNETATQHYLSKNEMDFFKTKVDAINNKIIKICNDNNLKGSWTLSADMRWLIRIGD